ncbi:hypothetical protein Tco_1505481 [Tanacetum coccineum]
MGLLNEGVEGAATRVVGEWQLLELCVAVVVHRSYLLRRRDGSMALVVLIYRELKPYYYSETLSYSDNRRFVLTNCQGAKYFYKIDSAIWTETLYAKFSKCEFWLHAVAFPWYFVAATASLWIIKVEAITNGVTYYVRMFRWCSDISVRELNMRQRRWLELLKDYDTNIQYHPGKANVVADALSRKSRMIACFDSIILHDLECLDVELCVREAQRDDGELWAIVQNVEDGKHTEFVVDGDGCCWFVERVKIEHQRASGLLQPLEIPMWKWDEISMDFVTGLPTTQKKT